MRKIKILALIFSLSLLFNSCGEYQRIAGKGTMLERYKLAVKKYEAKEYSKALRLFELVIPSYRGKPQMERIQFMVAQSNFNEKNYSTISTIKIHNRSSGLYIIAAFKPGST